MRKLVIETPSEELVDAYLGEIAKAYSVKWASASSTAAAQGSVVVR
jgi:vacuolar protein sorting-associated protein IST1